MFFEKVPCRFVLWLMSFLSYTIQYLLISNLNIAITSMVDNTSCNSSSATIDDASNCVSSLTEAEKFSWNESEKSLILGAVYWLMWAAHLVGGMLSHVLGSKLVIGFSILISSGICFAIPAAAAIHYKLLIVVRIVQGFVIGLSFPSIMSIVQYWVPEYERGRFLTAFLGINLGSASANFLGGIIIQTLNWKIFFYITGMIGVTWCIFWKYLMYDKPTQHPRISSEELTYLKSVIETTIPKQTKRSHLSIPWYRILTSVRVISNSLVQFGTYWSLHALVIYAPSYIRSFYNLDILAVGFATSIPFLLRIPLSIAYSALSDKLIEKKVMSTTNVRKLSAIISNVLPGVMFAVLVIYSDHLWTVLVSIGCAIIFSGATISSGKCSLIDMSPTYGGVLQGLAGAFATTSGLLIPMIVGYLTSESNTISQWCIFFSISGAICISSGFLFLVVWRSDMKEWNRVAEHDEPLKPFKNVRKSDLL